MILYRISRPRYAADITGTGARLTKGRWNPMGVPVVYTASSVALAALEVYVNMRKDLVAKIEFMRVDIEVPETSVIEFIEISDLPGNWADKVYPDVLPEIGRAWANRCSSLLLRVPAASLGGHEYNYLVNPCHPDMKSVKVVKITPFTFDTRMTV